MRGRQRLFCRPFFLFFLVSALLAPGDKPTAFKVYAAAGSTNQIPTATPQSVTTAEDTPVSIELTGADADQDTLTFQIDSQTVNGTLSGLPPSLVYEPAENFNGPDHFTFTVNDGQAGSEPAAVTIAVTAVNDAPVAQPQSVSVDENHAGQITLTASDPDNNVLVYEIVQPPAHGGLFGTAPDLTYQPEENFNGSDGFAFKVNDGSLGSDSAEIALTIHSINDPPTAQAGPDQAVFAGDRVSLDGSAFFDVDDNTLNYQWAFTSLPPGSQAVLSNSTAAKPSFTADLPGLYAIQLIVKDGQVESTPDTLSITANYRMIAVPDVSAMLQNEAEATISAAGLIVGVVTDAHNKTVPAGCVISQNPVAGNTVQEGSAVNLSISLGPVMVIMPDVVGMDMTEAKAAISGAHLSVGWINTVQSDLIPKNQVVEQVPTAATSVPEDAAVDMIISLPSGEDDDNDGLADVWEFENFGNLDPETDDDSDGDGYSNYQEYLIGTDPNDPAEAPVPAGNFYEYDEFGRIISKQITLEPECNNGECADDVCEGIDCGEDTCGSYGNWYCQDENIRRRDRTCIDRGCSGGGCYEYKFTDYEPEFCSEGCINGICVTYSWYTGACNLPCGGGTRSVFCRRSDGTPVEDDLCSGPKPPSDCNTQECPEVCYYEPGNGGTYFFQSCRKECTEFKYAWKGMQKVPVECLNWTLDCYWKLHFSNQEIVFELNEMAPTSYEKNGYLYRKGGLMKEPSCDPREISCKLLRTYWGVTTTRFCKNCDPCNN